MKLSATDILANLHHPDGRPIIPPGSVVYLSTDDPEGKTEYVERLRRERVREIVREIEREKVTKRERERNKKSERKREKERRRYVEKK